MLTIVFPGQGSQRRGMGKDLFDAFATLEREADAILGYSIRELCVHDPHHQLSRTEYTQPAVYTVNALSYLARQRTSAPKPDFVAGHSLGEYNALWVAGCFDFATGLRLVKRRGELMAEARGGGMAAVVGLTHERVHGIVQSGAPGLDVANLNTPKQIVVAGPLSELERAKPLIEQAGGTFISLPVSAPFHSRYMQPAQRSFDAFLAQVELSEPRLPVVSNATARPYPPGELKQLLTRQLGSPVHWCDTVRYLMGRGDMRFEEVGHGDVLTRMIAQITREATPLVEVERASSPLAPAASSAPAAPVEVERARPVSSPRETEARPAAREPRAEALGSRAFREAYGLRLAYAAGSMYRGIASEELVLRMARARLLSFFGTAGLSIERVRSAIHRLRSELTHGQTFGMNLLNAPSEAALVDLYLEHGIDLVEASAYVQLSDPLVRYRALGLRIEPSGHLQAKNRIIAKVSRPEVAELFLRPPPQRVLKRLVESGQLTTQQAQLAERAPMADDLCVEADSGGHTDGGVAFVLLPSLLRLRDRVAADTGLSQRVRVGAAGGIGTPEAVLAAFTLGADFVLTGSINQCSVEAAHSELVKDMLEGIDVQDTDYAPAGDMFELGARVQVLKRGVFFPARANRLFELYRNFPSLEAIDEKTRTQIEKTYFHRSFAEVFEEVKKYRAREDIERAERDARYKMGLVFKWYFAYTNELAFQGAPEHRVNFQVHCGPALGAFNRWVQGTPLERWRARHVDDIAERLMNGAAAQLSERLSQLASPDEARHASAPTLRAS